MGMKRIFYLHSSSWFPHSSSISLWQRWYKMEQQVSSIFFLFHQPGCRFIIVKVLMDFEISPSFEGQNGGLLYRLSASRQTGEKRFLRDPQPDKKPSSSACQSITLPARARLLTFWETVILRSPVDFKLMTVCFLCFQNRRSANLSFPMRCFLGSFLLRIQSDFLFFFNFYL